VIQIRRALLSVYDKTGIEEIARALGNFGCEIISTGGTGKILKDGGIPFVDISKFTGNPECFGGRVKTLSFQIEAAILYRRDKDQAEAEKQGIKPIDLVICNLYPFRKKWESDANFETLIENIDIGGPTLIRSAAKNFQFVAVLTDPNDYPQFIRELNENRGMIQYDARYKLMRKAFSYTADYDGTISMAMDGTAGIQTMRMTFSDGKQLRYGENPHQRAWVYESSEHDLLRRKLTVLGGKELSYNNYIDVQAALGAVDDLDDCGCAVVKHANPCGYAQGKDQRKILEAAWKGDPISAYGSIIAFNREATKETMEYLDLYNTDKTKRKFVEIVIAPSFTKDALDYLRQSKTLRVIEYRRVDSARSVESVEGSTEPCRNPSCEFRFLDGILLKQEKDEMLFQEIVEKSCNKPNVINNTLISFGIKASKHVKSNAVVIVRTMNDGTLQLLGIGAGQPNRIQSTRLAVSKCVENLNAEADEMGMNASEHLKGEMEKVVLVSDGFFPFPDSIEECAKSGIKNIVQPGGSIRDEAVIKKCAELGLNMVFTGTRHFKH